MLTPLLAFVAPSQHWHHALPPDQTCGEVRYNLTFRRVVNSEEQPELLNIKD